MKKKQKLIVICGPTASGKSDLAVKIAKYVGGEVISADSRQVYTGLDIGTGKITKREMQGVPHHLLDVADPRKPRKTFSVERFKKMAEQKIKEIVARGNMPILCGGTGFYIDAVIYDRILPEVQENKKLRKELAKKSLEKLFAILDKLDPQRAKTIDKQNPVRLIRAIEIAKVLGKVPKLPKNKNPYDLLQIGTEVSDEKLKARIHARLLSRIKQGMIAEAQQLHKNGLSYKRMEELGLEYRYLSLFLQKKLSRQELIDTLSTKIWQYSRRQKTWWRKDKHIKWIDPASFSL